MSGEERYGRLRSREYELVQMIKAIQRRAIDETMPLAMELQQLREHRDGLKMQVNGQVFEYIGPRLDYKLPEER